MAGEASNGAGATLDDWGAPTARAIGLNELSAVADEVRELIAAGQERRAFERVRVLHPADMGLIIAGLPGASREALLRVMSPQTVAWMLQHMNPVEAGRFGARLGVRGLSFVLGQLHPQQALATLRRLPLRRARAVAETLDQPLPVAELLAEEAGTAGALMVTAYPTVSADGQAAAARDSVAELGPARLKFTHVFVVGPDGELVSEVPMVDLALAEPDAPIADISAPVVASVSPATDAKECARLRRHYNLTQLPVVEDGRLTGVILAESLLSAVVEQDTRQMLQVASVAGESADGPLSGSIRTRLPWLTINLATTFLAAATIALFESTLAQVVVLAAFLPVVAGQGGIGGTQTLTLIVRAIALGELVGVTARRLLIREAMLGLLHGVWLGVLVAVVAMLWKDNLGLSLVLGLAMLGNMVIAGSVGAAVPLFLRRIGVDPAVASAVVVTTFTDVFGFLLFLGIARVAIDLLV
ncbi:MAG: magnesium transporter [Dehalococcoidia bacterium]|nr:magnesium transporter [Dehalococcoidia bacterium]MXY88102.1 magnesium transporter [Dehalococcoidia bacterium]MYA52223.1 magnesium transporter [Dehalococcoidia bacterium]